MIAGFFMGLAAGGSAGIQTGKPWRAHCGGGWINISLLQDVVNIVQVRRGAKHGTTRARVRRNLADDGKRLRAFNEFG
jgi:hypothetical protein